MATLLLDPKKIASKHVLRAAHNWNGSFPPFHSSRKYDVIIEGKLYPPKAILGMAYIYATGTPLTPNDFGGAKEGRWNNRLRELKFKIIEKFDGLQFESAVKRSRTLSREKRLAAIAKNKGKPPVKIMRLVAQYSRDPNVVAERLELANGKCAKCNGDAPFLRAKDKTPFLEVHHIQPLSKGGWDTVDNTAALCPNCHSEVHDIRSMDRDSE